MTDYSIDELSWSAAGRHAIALPIHLDIVVEGLAWRPEPLGGAGGLEDGFDFITEAEVATPAEWPLRAVATEPDSGACADVWLSAPSGTRLWRVTAPAPPSHPTGSRQFAMLECTAPRGAFTTVVAPRRTIAGLSIRDASLVIEHADGSVHEHAGGDASWRIALRAANATSSIDLGGAIARPTVAERDEGEEEAADVTTVAAGPETTLSVDPHRALSFSLGERDYRRSEESWTEAGEPTAEVVVATASGELHVTVTARTGPSVVISDEAVNEMDNEQPDVNATGLQLSIRDARGILHRWLVRPGADEAPRVRPLTRETIPRRIETTVDAEHWVARITIPLGALGDASPYFIALGVTINEIAPGRERRRGQLVLGGAEGEWVYLRGDRDDPSKLIPIVIDR